MHQEAQAWINNYASSESLTVLDIGGRNINGSALVAWPNADCTVLDIRAGSGVDIVADAAEWTPDKEYDVVVCSEVFEHTASWPEICETAFKACKPGGLLVLTMAGPGRAPHSAVDGGWQLQPGEYYGNVELNELRAVLELCGFRSIHLDQQFQPCDVRASARKPTDDNLRGQSSDSG